jgi:hypothetical protein
MPVTPVDERRAGRVGALPAVIGGHVDQYQGSRGRVTGAGGAITTALRASRPPARTLLEVGSAAAPGAACLAVDLLAAALRTGRAGCHAWLSKGIPMFAGDQGDARCLAAGSDGTTSPAAHRAPVAVAGDRHARVVFELRAGHSRTSAALQRYSG